MKKRFLSLLLAVVMVISLLPTALAEEAEAVDSAADTAVFDHSANQEENDIQDQIKIAADSEVLPFENVCSDEVQLMSSVNNTGKAYEWNQSSSTWGFVGADINWSAACALVAIAVQIARSGAVYVDEKATTYDVSSHKGFNPGTFAKALRSVGGVTSAAAVTWDAVSKVVPGFTKIKCKDLNSTSSNHFSYYPATSKQAIVDSMKYYLDKGYYPIIEGPGSTYSTKGGRHYVAVIGVTSNDVRVIDSSTGTEKSLFSVSLSNNTWTASLIEACGNPPGCGCCILYQCSSSLCSHSKINCGVCPDCHTDFNSTIKDTTIAAKYKVTAEMNMKEKPYANDGYNVSKTVKALKVGDIINAQYGVQNYYGNTWYYGTTSDGYTGYVYAGSLTLVDQTKPTLSISGATKPSKVDLGKIFNLYGTISTNVGTITSVTGRILTSSGSVVQEYTVNPNAKSYDINTKVGTAASINTKLTFGSLSAGNYIYTLTATAKNGSQTTTTEMIRQSFIVGDTHTHVFDQQVITSGYLAIRATCTEPAAYFYSCTCGTHGNQAFFWGNALGHSWDSGTVTKAATHMATGVRTYTCSVCGQTRIETIAKTTTHTCNKRVVSSSYFASTATCTDAAQYYYSCECGVKSDSTFSYGEPLGHNFVSGECTRCHISDPSTNGTCGDNLTYSLINSTLYIYGSGEMEDYSPNSAPWFNLRDRIKKVCFEGDITSVGNRAFDKCTNLTEVVLPDDLTYIGSGAFMACEKLESISIPKKVTYIGSFAFVSCSSLTEVVIPDSVTTIGSNVFVYCTNLSDVSISNRITAIPSHTFDYCTSLETIEIPEGVTQIYGEAFRECSSLNYIYIPDSVRQIGKEAFQNCTSLDYVYLPDSVTKLGESAFNGCSLLERIRLPEGIYRIEPQTFADCTNLVEVEIPYTIKFIGESAFYGCTNISDIFYEDTSTWWDLIEIEDNNDSLFDAEFHCYEYYGQCGENACWELDPYSGTLIIYGSGEMYDFYYSPWYMARYDINRIEIEEGIISIGGRAFFDCCYATEVFLPDSLLWIGSSAFTLCSGLEEIAIPNSVNYIGGCAFECCSSLLGICLPNGIECIWEGTFDNCPNLKTVTIPVSVFMIDDYAFCWCDSLETIYYTGTYDQWDNIYIGCDNDGLDHVTVYSSAHAEASAEVTDTQLLLDVYSEVPGSILVAFYDNADGRLKLVKSFKMRTGQNTASVNTAALGLEGCYAMILLVNSSASPVADSLKVLV